MEVLRGGRGVCLRMQASLYKLDREMESVVLDCERVVAESNYRFKQAIKSLAQMDATMRNLRWAILEHACRHVGGVVCMTWKINSWVILLGRKTAFRLDMRQTQQLKEILSKGSWTLRRKISRG